MELSPLRVPGARPAPGLPDPDFNWPGMPRVLSAKRTPLAELIATTGAKTFTYVYDFGDDWEHKVKIEKTCEPAPGAVYPRLTEASGRCPPEDVGGPWGYAEYLEAMARPQPRAPCRDGRLARS